jgi:hypothetical protein
MGTGEEVMETQAQPPLQVLFQYPFSDPLLTFSVCRFGLGLCLFMVNFFHPGFKGEDSQRCLGPTFKPTSSLGSGYNQGTDGGSQGQHIRSMAEMSVLDRYQVCKTRLCSITWNFTCADVSPSLLAHKAGHCIRLEVGNLEYLLQVPARLC